MQIVLNPLIIILTTWLGFFGLLGLTVSNVSAQGIQQSVCRGSDLTLSEAEKGQCHESTKGSTGSLNNLIARIVNILSVIVGVVAVIMIIIGGFRYITSGGDSGNVTSAKNTIIYAIVGLIIVAFAQFIVKFVLAKTTGVG